MSHDQFFWDVTPSTGKYFSEVQCLHLQGQQTQEQQI
jgi:hypothetical protein